MKELSRRFLRVLLCTALVAGLLCGLAVMAAAKTVDYYEVDPETGMMTAGTVEVEEEQAPASRQPAKQVRSIGVDEDTGLTTFTTFEELKQMATDTATDPWGLRYVGEGPLTIEEDLLLDNVYMLNIEGQELIIPEGVTLTLPEGRELFVSELTVNGILENDSYMAVMDALTVSGTLKNSNQISVAIGATLEGNANIISVGNGWTGYFRNTEITSGAQLKDAALLAAEETDSRWEYEFFTNDVVVLEESVTIPENACLYVNAYGEDAAGFTVAEGVTLTLKGILQVNGTMAVYGTLNNESAIYVQAHHNNLLTVAQGGSYTGTGKFELYGATAEDVPTCLPWLDLDQYFISEDMDRCILYNTAGMTQLGKPTDLQWGYTAEWDWDEENQEEIIRLEERPGGMVWKTAMPDQADAVISIYDAETDELVQDSWWGFGVTYEPQYRSADEFILSDLGSGTYYFTVQSKGDGIEYYDSEVAKSDNWTYVQPEEKLGVCTNLTLEDLRFSWDQPENATYLGGYYVDYYFAESLDAEPYNIGGSWWWSAEETNVLLEDHWVLESGAGYYGFKVRALSADITKSQNGDWSELSELVFLEDVIGDTDNILTDIVLGSGDMTEEEIRDNVQALDTEELKYALLADSDNQGATADLAALEAAVGGPADVAVSQEVTAFDSALVSIVGANLNTNTSDADPITLVIDKPEREDVIPDLYNSSIAVSFSMTLDNVEDTQNLEVPVKIKMPVPSNINPNYLVILHYHADGSMEELWPVITAEGRQLYANFVLTSFSDFVFTEYKRFDIAFANMTLGNSLAMNFAFPQDAMEDWDGCYAKIVKTYADGRANKEITIPYAQWGSAGINGVAHFALKFDGVAAKEMSDSVYVTIYDAQGNAISNTWEDSVRGYAMRTLNNPKTSKESAIMVVDLLNYGAAAQAYFNYNVGDLANNQMTEAQKALATQDAPAEDIRVKGPNYLGSNLGLESQILMRMAFKGTDTSMYATIEFTNHAGREIKVELEGSEFGATGAITIDEIVIADGRKPVTVTIYNADGSVYASATDSMESYIARMRVDKYDPLFEAILKFSDSAYNFFH